MSTDYYFNYLSGGYFRSDPTFGTEYMVDVVFSAKDVKKSKEVYSINCFYNALHFFMFSLQYHNLYFHLFLGNASETHSTTE